MACAIDTVPLSFFYDACLFIGSINKLSNSLNLFFIEQCSLLITEENGRSFSRSFTKFFVTT